MYARHQDEMKLQHPLIVSIAHIAMQVRTTMFAEHLILVARASNNVLPRVA